MRWVFRITGLLIIVLLSGVLYVMSKSYDHTDLAALPPLQSGDLIFETTMTNQTLPIMVASGSFYTHVGIVSRHEDGSITVIHAARHVTESPLSEFVRYAWGEKLLIRRYPDLTADQREAIVARARSYVGKPYNYVFYMKSDSIYCSELPYLAFNGVHVPLGTTEKIGELHVNNSAVEKLFDRRWRMHPACQKPGMDEKACWQTVMQEPIITPVNLAHDTHMVNIYDNYPF